MFPRRPPLSLPATLLRFLGATDVGRASIMLMIALTVCDGVRFMQALSLWVHTPCEVLQYTRKVEFFWVFWVGRKGGRSAEIHNRS